MPRYKVTESYCCEEVGMKKVEDCWTPYCSRTDTVLPKAKAPTISPFPVPSNPLVPPPSPVSVYVRVRPLEETGVMSGLVTETSEVSNTGVVAFETDSCTVGGFAGVLGPEANNDLVFQRCLKPRLDNVMEGGTASLFCYGCTGGGKSYTVLGGCGEERGVFVRAVEELLDRMEDNYPEDGLFVVVTAVEVAGDMLFNLMGEEKKLVVKTKDDLDAIKTKALQIRMNELAWEHGQRGKSHVMLKMEIMKEEMMEAREAAEEARAVIPALLSAVENHDKVSFYALCDSRSSNESIGLKQVEGGQKEWDKLRAELDVRRDLLEKAVGQDSAVVEKIEAAYERLREVQVHEAVGGAVVLVDLAAADFAESDVSNEEEKKEREDVNKSLMELRECFRSISMVESAEEKTNFQGNSKLTKILEEALFPGAQSGRRNRCSETVLMLNVSPEEPLEKKTLNVLRYGQLFYKFCDESAEKTEDIVPRGQKIEDKRNKVKQVKKGPVPTRKEYRWKS